MERRREAQNKRNAQRTQLREHSSVKGTARPIAATKSAIFLPNVPGVSSVHTLRSPISRIRGIGSISMTIEEDTP